MWFTTGLATEYSLLGITTSQAGMSSQGITQTLPYLKPLINNKEIFNLYHESNIELNEVHHFSKKIFNNNDIFLDTSKDIAKALHGHSTHPNILIGELIIILYKGILIDNNSTQAIGIYKTEVKDNYFDVQEDGETLILASKQGIPINKIQKGALILEDGNVFAIDSLNQKTKYWYNDFLKIKLKKTPENNAQILNKVMQKYVPVERDQGNFLKVIGEFIEILEGELPDAGSECQTCTYLVARNALD